MANEEEGGKIGLELKEIREFVEEGTIDMKKDKIKRDESDFCSLFTYFSRHRTWFVRQSQNKTAQSGF